MARCMHCDGASGPLTPREAEVLRLVASGHTAKEIARRLAVSVHTVRNHQGNIYRKLEVTGRGAPGRKAVAVARERGLLDVAGEGPAG